VLGAARSNPALYGDTPVWLDAGTSDRFNPLVTDLAAALSGRVSAHTDWPGGHTEDYWDAHWRSYAKFYARALKQCRR
jgi:hypothetical protein